MSNSLRALTLGSTLSLAACGGTVNRAPIKPQEYAQKAPASEQRMETNEALNGVVAENRLNTNPSKLDAQTAEMCKAIDAELVKDFDSGRNLCIVPDAAPASLIGASRSEIRAAALKAAKMAMKRWLESQPDDWPARGAFECIAGQGDLPPICEAITPPQNMNWNTCQITEDPNPTVKAACKGFTR